MNTADFNPACAERALFQATPAHLHRTLIKALDFFSRQRTSASDYLALKVLLAFPPEHNGHLTLFRLRGPSLFYVERWTARELEKLTEEQLEVVVRELVSTKRYSRGGDPVEGARNRVQAVLRGHASALTESYPGRALRRAAKLSVHEAVMWAKAAAAVRGFELEDVKIPRMQGPEAPDLYAHSKEDSE